MTIGIYRIYNIKNKKSYVGSSNNIESRFKEHLRMLKNNSHHSASLQNSWNRTQDKTYFIFEILETLDSINILKEREQYFIDLLDSYRKGYNCSAIADNPRFTKINQKKNEKTKFKINQEDYEGSWRKKGISKFLLFYGDPNIFFRNSFAYQINHNHGAYYKSCDFIFLCEMIDYYYQNFNTNQYKLSMWRSGASISAGNKNNSEDSELNTIVDYGYEFDSKNNKIFLAYVNKSFIDYNIERILSEDKKIKERRLNH